MNLDKFWLFGFYLIALAVLFYCLTFFFGFNGDMSLNVGIIRYLFFIGGVLFVLALFRFKWAEIKPPLVFKYPE
jgi:hypothetical protein